jgi:hypothetical protein
MLMSESDFTSRENHSVTLKYDNLKTQNGIQEHCVAGCNVA